MKYITKIKPVKHKKTSHKGENGLALIIGGSKDYTGTLALAGLAALRTGTDIVTIAAPEKVAWAINALSPDLITKKFKGEYFTKKHVKDILKLSKGFDAVLIGNGLGPKNKQALEFAKLVIKQINKPLVVDADGIKAISINDVDNAIITPHIPELELFLKNSKINKNIIKKIINEKNIIKKAKLIQKTLKIKNNVILLKGKTDAIISKDKIIYNKTGNEAMTVAGTGDVLAGIALGFLAQGLNLMDAACNAAYINGKIGDYEKKKKGYSFIASDLIEDYKKVIKKR